MIEYVNEPIPIIWNHPSPGPDPGVECSFLYFLSWKKKRNKENKMVPPATETCERGKWIFIVLFLFDERKRKKNGLHFASAALVAFNRRAKATRFSNRSLEKKNDEWFFFVFLFLRLLSLVLFFLFPCFMCSHCWWWSKFYYYLPSRKICGKWILKRAASWATCASP